ncbi:hypothetical protein D3C78_1581980 [compost metagenome]
MDGHSACARNGIGLGACMQAQRVEAGVGITGHLVSRECFCGRTPAGAGQGAGDNNYAWRCARGLSRAAPAAAQTRRTGKSAPGRLWTHCFVGYIDDQFVTPYRAATAGDIA